MCAPWRFSRLSHRIAFRTCLAPHPSRSCIVPSERLTPISNRSQPMASSCAMATFAVTSRGSLLVPSIVLFPARQGGAVMFGF